MPEQELRELPVLMVAMVKGENVSPVGLPILRFYVSSEGEYLLWEGKELIEAALIESVKQGNKASIISISFAVEVLPMSERPRRKGRQV